MVLHSHLGSINSADPANNRQVHEDLMSQVRNEAIYISNKNKNQTEPIKSEWDKFLPTFEKDLQEILNEILSCNNNQKQPPYSNENSNTPNENRNQYKTVINHRTRMLTTLSPSSTHTSRACGY